MLPRKTVFIVGAGASVEFGLPVGTDLQHAIAKLVHIEVERYGPKQLRGDHSIRSALRAKYGEALGRFYEAGRHIHDSVELSHSIDDYIDTHREDPEVVAVGKLGIAKAIVEAERTSKLWVDPGNIYNRLRFSNLKEAWIRRLFIAMKEGVKAGYEANFFQKATFIVFNYDRCVEHFFYWALKTMYKLSDIRAAEIVNDAVIVHPYGTIGSLPWQRHTGGAIVEFGNTDANLNAMAEGIRTYTEQVTDADLMDRVKGTIAHCSTLCFLGFSYQPQNMDLLTPKDKSAAVEILGTAFGMKKYERDKIHSSIRERFVGQNSPDFFLEDLTCDRFVADFGRAFRTS